MFVHFEPVNHAKNNKAEGRGIVEARKLRKASDSKKEDHNDQHEDHEKHEKLKHVEDKDPVSKFGGPKHDIEEDIDTINAHRKKKQLAEASKKVAAGAELAVDTDSGSNTKSDGQKDTIIYKHPELSEALTDILARKDVSDLGTTEQNGGDGFRSILHQVAQMGDIATITKLLKGKSAKEMETLVNAKDSSGWQPLHEAVRGTVVVEYI